MRKKSSLQSDGPVVVMIQLRRFMFVVCPRCRAEYELEDEVYEYVTCTPCNLTLMIDQKEGHNIDEDEDFPIEENFDADSDGRGIMSIDLE